MFPKKLINYLRQDTHGLMNMLCNELKSHKYIVTKEPTFVFATPSENLIPVLLVAHLDTFHIKPPTNIYTDTKNTVMWSPQGIGGDDRCGVYCIMELIKQFKCAVLFTDLEERGAIGAKDFIKEFPKNSNYKMALQFDRKNGLDSVFYDNDQMLFEDYINSFGFVTSMGSFSDISVIAPKWQINAVNLSVGFYNEHTNHEYIDYTLTQKTIERVTKMLSQPIPVFEYKEIVYANTWPSRYDKGYTSYNNNTYASSAPYTYSDNVSYVFTKCDYCGTSTGKSYKVKDFNLCTTCNSNFVKVCQYCAEDTLDFDLKIVYQHGRKYEVCSECVEAVDATYDEDEYSYDVDTAICYNCKSLCYGDKSSKDIIITDKSTMTKQVIVCEKCYYDKSDYCSVCDEVYFLKALSETLINGVTCYICSNCIAAANSLTADKNLRSVV